MDISRPKHRNPFPNLNASNHRTTSPATVAYNCFGWAIAGEEISMGPQADYRWPSSAPFDLKLSSIQAALAEFGFVRCDTGALEEGFLKVALLGGEEYVDHAARQLADGRWTSKLGREEDIEHDLPEAVSGGVYGPVVAYFKRPIRT